MKAWQLAHHLTKEECNIYNSTIARINRAMEKSESREQLLRGDSIEFQIGANIPPAVCRRIKSKLQEDGWAVDMNLPKIRVYKPTVVEAVVGGAITAGAWVLDALEDIFS